MATATGDGSFKLSLRFLVVGVVVFTALLIAAAAIGLQYYFSRNIAIDAATNRYQMTTRATHDFIQNAEDRAIQITRILARYPTLINTRGGQPSMRDLFAEVMHTNPMFYSIYLGFPNGDFYEVSNLDSDEAVRKALGATEADRWMINSVVAGENGRVRTLEFYNEDFELLHSRRESSQYDVRERRWFVEATEATVSKSAPYLFQYIQKPGQTYSIKLPVNGNVLGIDITLESFSTYLQTHAPEIEGDLYLYQPSGEIIASSRLQQSTDSLPQVSALALTGEERAYIDSLGVIQVSNEMDWPPVDFAVAGEPKGYSVDLIRLLATKLELPIEFINGYTWEELVYKYEIGQIDILQPLPMTAQNRERGLQSDPILDFPYGLAVKPETPAVSREEDLSGKTLAIPSGWSIIQPLRELYPDVNILEVDSNRAALQAVITGEAFAAVDSQAILTFTARQYFMDDQVRIDNAYFLDKSLPTSLSLLFSRDMSLLHELFNRALSDLSPEAVAALENKWFSHDSVDAIRQILAIVPYKFLLNTYQDPNNFNQLRKEKLEGKDYFIFTDLLHSSQGAPEYFSIVTPAINVVGESLRKVMIAIWVTGFVLLLLLPISWLFSEFIIFPIRKLHNKTSLVKERRYKEVCYRPSVIKEVDELSAALVSMAESIQQHEKNLRQLMEDIIRLIADAIDEKSPYTAGHCARVPELALMLVEEAERSNDLAFRHFAFANEDERAEFRIGAWLHDCGKITVPEHIVDKGTKLECIYNRIHEVRMRFEVLWRDAHIHCLQKTLENPGRADEHAKALLHEQEKLLDDFSFVAETNIGGEFLDKQKIERLARISQTTWQRYFDDRLGLSPVEEQRLAPEKATLPATERLLMDKPCHIIARVKTADYYKELGVRMEIPEHLYNLGELHNLRVSRGTLTEEDRFKINEHIISTIRMLEGLPFPEELAQVPRYASTHHETMIGTGYPRKLSAEDLSIPERIMAVADIFEALTAADRPYKKAKSLSESIRILHQMALDEHVDIEVFRLFLTSGVYLKYAERYLDPSQIDEVNLEAFL